MGKPHHSQNSPENQGIPTSSAQEITGKQPIKAWQAPPLLDEKIREAASEAGCVASAMEFIATGLLNCDSDNGYAAAVVAADLMEMLVMRLFGLAEMLGDMSRNKNEVAA